MTQGGELMRVLRGLGALLERERLAEAGPDLERIVAEKEALLVELEGHGRGLAGALTPREAAEAAPLLARAAGSNSVLATMSKLRAQLAKLSAPKAGPSAPRVNIVS